MKHYFLKLSELLAVLLIPLVLLSAARLGWQNAYALTLFAVIAALLPFFLRFESQRPRPRDIVPIVVMSVIAALARVVFAAVPSFKPTSAVVIVSALAFGPQAGFLTGALAALGSNMFLGQGLWTPWQMYAWGIMGFGAGILARLPFFRRKGAMLAYGFFSSLTFGWLMNLWFVVGYVSPFTWQAAAATYGASLPFDLIHGCSTLVFLSLILVPWQNKLERIKRKYGLMGDCMGKKILPHR